MSGPQFCFDLRGDGGSVLELDVYEPIGESFFFGGVSARAVRSRLKTNAEAKTIKLRINSRGGDVTDGLAIYQLLKEHKASVEVDVDGIAASMASVLAMAGDVIRMAPGAFMMVHNPWAIGQGEADDFRAAADLLDKQRDVLAKIYAERSGEKFDDVVALMKSTTYMNADEAKKRGFADEVKDAKAKTKTSAALRAFAAVEDEDIPEHVRAAIRSAASEKETEPEGAPAPQPLTKVIKMKFIALLTAMGLSSEASEEAALQAFNAVRVDADVGKKLRGLTGKDGDAAIGTVSAWKEQAEKVPALESAAIETKAAADKGALTTLIDKARTDKKLTKDGADKLQARVEAGFKAKDEMRASGKIRDLNDDEWTLGQAKAYVEALTPNAVLAGGNGVKPPKVEPKDAPQGEGAELFNGKAYEDYTPGEMAKLRPDMGEETYASLRSDWERRGKPRKSAPAKPDAA